MQNTILFFGGSSDERWVSTASAQNLCQRYDFSRIWFLSLTGTVHEISKTDLLSHKEAFTADFPAPANSHIAASLKAALPRTQDAVIFMGFHGTEGENGDMQALLEEERVPFTGSGSRASQSCFDKVLAKKIVSAAGIQVTEELTIDSTSLEDFEKLKRFFNQHSKIVLKPTANGSSIGLFIVNSVDTLNSAIKEIQKKPKMSYLAEKFVQGRECTIGIIENETGSLVALPASEVIMQDGLNFDYNGKYLGKGSTEITPAPVTLEQMTALQAVSLKAHQALGCTGYSRTDVILCPQGEIIYLETNTLPGLTKASFIPQQLEEAKIALSDFIQGQLQIARKRYG